MHAEAAGDDQTIKLSEVDVPQHLRDRMEQRGIVESEIEYVLNVGWEATDAKSGTSGRVAVFPFRGEWQGTFYEEKEVTVYYKEANGDIVLLTAKARYGESFPKGPRDED